MKGYKVTDINRATYKPEDVLPLRGIWTKTKPKLPAGTAELCTSDVWHMSCTPAGAGSSWSPSDRKRAKYFLWEAEGWGVCTRGGVGGKWGFRRIRLTKLIGIIFVRDMDNARMSCFHISDALKWMQNRNKVFLSLTRGHLLAASKGRMANSIRQISKRGK